MIALPSLVDLISLADPLCKPLSFVWLKEDLTSDHASLGLPRVGGRGPGGGFPTAGVDENCGRGVVVARGREAWLGEKETIMSLP